MTLIVSAVVWIVLTLRESIGQLPASLDALRPNYLVVACMPAIVSVVISAYMYYLVLSAIIPVKAPFHKLARPFLAAQAVRYLPGKIWGIFYLAQATAEFIPARYTVSANVVYFSLATFNSIVVAICVYVYYLKGITPALMTYAILLPVVYLVLKTHFLQRIAAIFSRARDYRRAATGKEPLLLGLFQADWLSYVIACDLILPASYSLGDSLVVATTYALAWIIGTLAVVLPGGILLREGSFLWFSSLLGFNPADMFLFSVVARILFTVSDVACAVLGIAFVKADKGHTESQ